MKRLNMRPTARHPQRPTPTGGRWLRCIAHATITIAGITAIGATPLDDHIAAFQNAVKQDEAGAILVLRGGIDENRSARAFAATKGWLANHPDASQKLSFQAAQVAERAGEWPAAVSHYRKLLADPSPDPALAAVAVPAVYRLLINHLDSPETAYLMMREDGTRLRAFGDARRFDSWFLQQAAQRNDLASLAAWHAALHAGNDPLDPFAASLDHLLSALETYQYDDNSLFTALEQLAAAPRASAETRARIAWVMAVIPYQKQAAIYINDRKPIPDVLLREPLAAAQQLISQLPAHGCQTVARGWMHYSHGDSPTFARFVEPLRAEKAAQLLAAMPRLTTDEARNLLNMRVDYAKGRPVAPYLLSPAELRALAVRMPELFNTLSAPTVTMVDPSLTPADAQALAPHLARNPHPDAALIRVFAAGKRRYPDAVEAMMAGEAWRFDHIKDVAQLVWDCKLFERIGKQNAPLGKYNPSSPQFQKLANDVTTKAPSPQRIAAFHTLLKDLTGTAPQIPGALPLWDKLFKQAADADAATMIGTLVANLSGEREYLLQRTLDQVSFGKSGRLPWQADIHPNHYQYHQQATRKGAAQLIEMLGRLLKEQAARGDIQPTIFGMWLHSAEPNAAANRTLMQAIAQSPGFMKLDPSYRRVAADANHFGAAAVTPQSHPHHPAIISRELLALPANATPLQVELALRQCVARAAQAPSPVAVIGLAPVASLPSWSPPTRELVLSLLHENAPLGNFPIQQGYEPLVERLARDFATAETIASIERHAPGLWHAASATDDTRTFRAATALAKCIHTALEAGQPSVAMTLARSFQKSRTGRLFAASDNTALKTQWNDIRTSAGQAATAIGAVEIPVDESDPTYPIHKSHAEFILGNVESAWTLYHKNADKLADVLPSLSPDYGLWLLERNIAANESTRAEELVKELTIWSRRAEGTFTPEQEAQLRIAYADLAFRKGALPTARAWYRKVADAAEYQGTATHLKAALGSVRVDRASKNFSAALDELDKLMRLPDPGFRMQIHYARAEVLMDQENYAEALDELEAVLRREPKHPDALILRGKIHYQMRKLVEASEIELGPSREDTVLVPGESLKINLRDPSLQVSGLGADIEVEVRAASGDVERLLLHQLGDSKEKFRAEITTALGAARPGDKVLQVLGKDEIRYGYSQRFRDRMDDLPPDPETVISVASDAQLALTAGAFPPREGERTLDIEELGLSTAQAALGTRAVRPGNPVYLRVIDADRSTTANPDEIHLDLIASSGDVIRKLTLTETGPFTGEFQAVVPTAPAQALAFASESAPGCDPNMAVSPNDYPGWQAEVGNPEKPRIFGVDLNDNAPVNTMVVDTGTDPASLTHFVVQTSMNGKDWTSRGRFPNEDAPWDGRPQLTSIPTYHGGLPASTPLDHHLPADWLEKLELGSIRQSVAYRSAHVTNFTPQDGNLVNTGHPGYNGLFRFRTMFHQPERAIRTFRIDNLPATDKDGNPTTIFLINGQPADTAGEDAPLTIQRELDAGLHTIEVWTHIPRAELIKCHPQLRCDTAGTADLSPCPDAMFDPATFPAGLQPQLPQLAHITPDGSKFNIQFGNHTQARMIRLVINGFAGVAPKITKATLDNRNGDTLLPVSRDYQTLRSNDQLEVLPGDRITARYEDPVSATPKRNRHEKSLGVAFNSGTITASFLNYEMNKLGERELVLEPIGRFRMDDAVAIVIEDADLDTGTERDTVECTVTAASGATIMLKALETENHSGRFIGRVFPVDGEPSRASEIRISPGDSLTATYRDTENLDPGIPTDRTTTISHAKYSEPTVDAYAVTTDLLPPHEPAAADKPSTKPSSQRGTGPETITPRYSISYHHVPAAGSSPLAAIIGAQLRFDVVAPHLALAPSSAINAYVQTDAARQAANAANKDFDLTVPGTLKLSGTLRAATTTPPTGHQLAAPPVPPTQAPPLDEGRFSFTLPLILGDPPERSFATKAAAELPASSIPEGLAVKAGDVVHVGFPWQDEQNNVHWRHLSFTVGGNAILDVMDNGYRDPLHSAYVGEKVHLRLIAPILDIGPQPDTAEVTISGTSGATTTYSLKETDAHSGVFKAVFTISYADGQIPAKLPPVALNGFPARYGDTITLTYQDQSHSIVVKKGADGGIEPFSKRFTGGEMAVRTSFTLAECYFELAKKHREMDQESLARREIGHARKLLAEALATHRDEDMKAHAEYLLGNLAQEFADLAKNDESKLPMYQDALARFIKIPTDYPDSEFAPKAQFKSALVYEKMGEIENSVEEYVKLAYKYPDNELIPMVMSRLGGYFQKKGQQLKEQADPLREKSDDASVAEVLRLDELSYPEFLNAAMVFAKLQQRFPDDPLAGMAGLRAGQNLMRAHHYGRAIDQFKRIMDNEQYDDADIRAQAVYWSGFCQERSAALMSDSNWKGRGESMRNAYQLYRRVTFDFPDSKWAKYARGRLADGAFAKLIEDENSQREKMIEALKENMKNNR